ncbi:uncharacterized protein LOC101462603 [Ceratitis capitata]|uniref:(Mediterranean fruit fly) hypothetical protein n=1 Tax=Ceratitis capitata TaxID=7213 RepID=A0A811VH11_CERCA|nr:uncharacterized protein LOC101462603 [Ceratitis capitata]XP_012162144.1 uncharacterized protein LOC101462603 [Ceratitis capitata]XP_020717718.1 uncharacterized protein LOC101462603 [Ceratitis capitata]XP_020717719.1 uncharacterized protein LOC101462603 [Ceratitis capitata]CAD7015165.1 unnamed protein product [Ceratitis capitata]
MACEIFNAFEGCIEELANQRPSLHDLDTELLPVNAPKSKSLIEISGVAEAGKSKLLWRLMAHCLAPTYFGGRNCDLIFIDMRHKFDLEHFKKQIFHLVASSGEPCTDGELNMMLEKCLDSIHLLNCYTPKHFDAALEIADGLLLKHSDCAMIAIDGLDAFYWLDTYEHRIRMQTHYARNVERVRQLCERHGICCAYTVDANYLGAKKTFGPPPFASSVNVEYRLQLQLGKNGERTLNGKPAEIIEDVLHIVKQQ